ncbi:MAG: ABC transporter substrate-binding protein [Rhodospirillales bacterium]|nr:ABC transporter substrate-binding protein [Rhodospirillales bacterium]
MKKILLAAAAVALVTQVAAAQTVKIGILLGFTGPEESQAPGIYNGAELAIKQIDASHAFLKGAQLEGVKGDDTCTDASAAVAAATRLVTSDHVAGIVGGHCSGVTAAVLQSVARPNGVVMISPSATSPSLSTAPSDGLFFRTAPSDARQGQVMADVLIKQGIKKVALTYTDNDYGKGLADAFSAAYKKEGGTITISLPHQDGKADYSAEVGTLAAAGGQMLVVAGYADQGGKGIIQGALDTGAFSKFYLPDGMYTASLLQHFGKSLDGSIGDIGESNSSGFKTFVAEAKKAGFDGTAAYSAQGYDAVALMALAMEAAHSTKGTVYKNKIEAIANGPGVKIYAGQLAKGLKLLSEGKAINYEGASSVRLIGPDSAGSYRVYTIKNGKRVTDYYE